MPELWLLLIPVLAFALYLFLDWDRVRIIRFQRASNFGTPWWEIAFDEEHLQAKLDGEMAEVIMPAKPLVVRLWRRLFPLRTVEVKDA